MQIGYIKVRENFNKKEGDLIKKEGILLKRRGFY